MPNLNLVQDIKNTPKYADVSVSSIARSLNNVTDGSKVPRMLNDCMALLLGAKWNLPRELRGYLNIPPQKDPRLYEIAHLMGGREPDGQLIEVSQSQDEDLDVLSAFETAEGEEQGDTIIILFLWMLVAQGHKKSHFYISNRRRLRWQVAFEHHSSSWKIGNFAQDPQSHLKTYGDECREF